MSSGSRDSAAAPRPPELPAQGRGGAESAPAPISLEPYAAALDARMRRDGLLLHAKPAWDRGTDAGGDYGREEETEDGGPETWLLEGGGRVADPEPVVLCRKAAHKHVEVTLGEGAVEHRAFLKAWPDGRLLQAVFEPWEAVTQRGSREQVCVMYTKERVFMYAWAPVQYGSLAVPVGLFPEPPAWPLPAGAGRCGPASCDVWTAPSVDLPIRRALDEHAAKTSDRPIPRYQMIIDPNQFVRERRDGATVWVPCEFDVAPDGSAALVGGARSHLLPELVDAVATPVLGAAMPLLAKLRRPRLLLEGRRLQVVVKAQRIIVPPSSSDGADSEYVGLWHVDGDREHVAAVVLYYYHVDAALEGGDMEFCGREPVDVLGMGDCSNNYGQVSAQRLRLALRGGGGGREAGPPPAHDGPTVPTCRVPVRTGTLLVFSNYQMVHRVLRMVNRSTEREASRDFVALFVIDPAAEPLVPARAFLAGQFVLRRTLTARRVGAQKLKESLVQLILEYHGCAPDRRSTLRRRCQLLRAQLQPKGQFRNLGGMYSTGNGCYTMIGWLDDMLSGQAAADDDWVCAAMLNSEPGCLSRLHALNLPPTKVGRGMSEGLSLPSDALEDRLAAWQGEAWAQEDDAELYAYP